MRKLISLAVACLVLLPATGIRAEVFPFGGGDDPGGERSGGGGEVGDDPRGSPESPDRAGSPDRVGGGEGFGGNAPSPGSRRQELRTPVDEAGSFFWKK